MGLPIDRLIVATNENDILYRFSSSGVFARGAVVPSVAPAIDIQVPYNFERFLYMMCDENADKVRAWMEEFEKHGTLTLDKELLTRSAQFIGSLSINSSVGALCLYVYTDDMLKDTLKTIGEYYKQHKYLLDPHTAVGVTAAQRLKHDRVIDETLTCICLATAHPGKFQDAITKAVGEEVPLPAVLAQLQSLPTQFLTFSADKQQAELQLRQLISTAF
jgi:threonine synthase